jgi:hypothetical protein
MNAFQRARLAGWAAALAAAAGLSAIAAPALAQSTVQCSETGTDEERIACLQARIDALEAELARARGELAAVEPAEEAAPVEDPAASFGAEQLEPAAAAPVAAAAAEPAARERRRWLRMPSVPFFGRDDEDEGESAPETAVAAVEPSAPASSPITGPESFGSEQLASVESRAQAREEDVLHASIIDFQELHRGRLVVALDNGQMWRQLDVDTRQIRLDQGESYPVEIRRSGFGGYRMKVGDNDRIMRVERIR